MKYKTKIVPENGGYVGYITLNEEVIQSTSLCRDASSAAKELALFVKSLAQNPVPTQSSIKTSTRPSVPDNNTPPPRSASPVSQQIPITPPLQNIAPTAYTSPAPAPPAPRRCCGRG